MAQAIHAAVELTLADPERSRRTPNTIVLSVRDEEDLLGWADRLSGFCHVEHVIRDADGKLLPFVIFAEPDLGGEHTALATFSTGEAFSSLPLAGRSLVSP